MYAYGAIYFRPRILNYYFLVVSVTIDVFSFRNIQRSVDMSFAMIIFSGIPYVCFSIAN